MNNTKTCYRCGVDLYEDDLIEEGCEFYCEDCHLIEFFCACKDCGIAVFQDDIWEDGEDFLCKKCFEGRKEIWKISQTSVAIAERLAMPRS